MPRMMPARMMLLLGLAFWAGGCAGAASERFAAIEASVEELRMQEARLTLTEDRLNSLSAELAYLKRGAEQEASVPGALSSGAGKRTEARRAVHDAAAKPSPGSGQTAPSTGKPAEQAYKRALSAFEAGKAEEALTQFTAFAQANPSDPLVPNALYWTGECHYSRKRYAEAIMAFKDVVGKYPKHPKAAAAMLKAGFAYERLQDLPNAKFYLETLVQDFPGTEPAALAKKKLAAL